MTLTQESTFKRRRHRQSISVTHPRIAREFHPTLNLNLSVEQLTAGSNRRIWWQCPCGHCWQTTPFIRTQGKGNCSKCQTPSIPFSESLAFLYPHLISEWHPTHNHPLMPEQVLTGSSKKVWWLCQTCQHEWQSVICSRTTNATGCPKCARQHHRQVMKRYQMKTYSYSIDITHPHLIPLWATHENLPLTLSHITENSQRFVFWRCKSCGELFQERVTLLTKSCRRHQCPTCRGDN